MKTVAFIDAANLFYGGTKSLGWKIDYKKLLGYLKEKYGVKKAYYFAGVEIHDFHFDYLKYDTVPLDKLVKHLKTSIKSKGKRMDDAKLILIDRHMQRIRFYLNLEKFGYNLRLKQVKLYYLPDGTTKKKANCDVDMAFYLMKEKDNFDRVVILSGDGDFLPVLKYLKKEKKEVIILARGPRTAREIRQFAGSSFRDFIRLQKYIQFKDK